MKYLVLCRIQVTGIGENGRLGRYALFLVVEEHGEDRGGVIRLPRPMADVTVPAKHGRSITVTQSHARVCDKFLML